MAITATGLVAGYCGNLLAARHQFTDLYGTTIEHVSAPLCSLQPPSSSLQPSLPAACDQSLGHHTLTPDQLAPIVDSNMSDSLSNVANHNET